MSYNVQGLTKKQLKLRLYLVNDCEVLVVDFLTWDLELTPLKVEYLKGHKALEGESPYNLVVLRTYGSLYVCMLQRK